MSIVIHGTTGDPNYAAAEKLKTALEPVFGEAPGNTHIIASAYTPGGTVLETDIVVLGAYAPPHVRIPRDLVPEHFHDRACVISNFLMAIEVKGHSQQDVRFDGNKVEVRYARNGGVWHSATEQNHRQIQAIRQHLERSGMARAPRVTGAIWLENVPTQFLPAGVHALLGSSCTWRDFVRLLVQLHHERLAWQQRAVSWAQYYVTAGNAETAQEVMQAAHLFTRKLQPSALDRTRIERITRATLGAESTQYMEKLGKQLLIFRGRGGSGKTMRLLQLASYASSNQGARTLLLTYNKALAADLQRLLVLSRLSGGSDSPGITVSTSESFFLGLLRAWNMAPRMERGMPYPEEAINKAKQDLLQLVSGESPETLHAETGWRENPHLVNYDHIMIDEAQDWPDCERDLLKAFFGPERIVVADGVDQLVRSGKRCEWTDIAPPARRQIVTLRKALRLKANLCRFVEAWVATHDLPWDLDVNDEVLGGDLMVRVGPYTRDVHERVFAQHTTSGNRPIDALMCVPKGAAGDERDGLPRHLQDWGLKVWDGISEASRGTMPDDVDQYRVVRYESCRGLEGWTAVCFDFDAFLAAKRLQARYQPPAPLMAAEQHEREFVARWGMIPMTRAIDRLVLQVSDQTSEGRSIIRLAEHLDFAQLI